MDGAFQDLREKEVFADLWDGNFCSFQVRSKEVNDSVGFLWSLC